MLTKSLPEALKFCASLVQQNIKTSLPAEFSDSRLVEAMRYSALSGGKRIRPFLTIVSAQIFGVEAEESVNAATALEFIHTYSLIHDDLPAMDNDDFRRGKLTCHKEFNEATAILAGDALLTYAFEILANPQTHKDPSVRCELVRILAVASGFRGMVGGQMMDLENSGKKISNEQLAKLHRLKTGELFIAACEMGAVLGHCSNKEKDALKYYAHDLGLAFQIKDDILDHEEVTNSAQENASIVDIVGLEQAKQQLEMLKEQAIAHIKIFGERAVLLEELMNFVVNRQE